MCLSLPSHKLDEIWLLAHSLLHRHSVMVHQVMSFLGKCNFLPVDTPNFGNGVLFFSMTCWMIIIPQLTCFVPFTFQIQLSVTFSNCQLQQSSVPLHFSHLDVVIYTDATPIHWAFYFQGSRLPSSMSGSWSGSMCRVHITLQELQAISLMLCRIAF